MLQKLTLDYVGPAQHMELAFADRLNLLTGDNGLGKSFLLDTAWWALTRTWAGELAWPQPGHRKDARISYTVRGKAKASAQVAEFDTATWSWRRRQGRKPNPGLVLYARVDGGFGVWDPARNYWREDQDAEDAWAKGSVESFLFSKEEVWNGLVIRTQPSLFETHGTVLSNGLLRDWVSWQRAKSPEFSTLCKVLEVLSPGEEEALRPGEPVRLSPQDARDVPTLQLPYGEIPLPHASAGARRILALAYLLVWSWHEHLRAAKLREETPTDRIVLLIDELEAHLHPRWQRLILPALLRVVQELRSSATVQVIAATHAPLMLASVETEFDPVHDALFTFDLVGNGTGRTVQVEKAAWMPHGDANSWLVSDVFDLKSPRSLEAEQALEEAKAALRQPNLEIEQVKRIHHRLHEVLKDTDPFWPRWELRAKAAGIEA
jgi:hypothetical protein